MATETPDSQGNQGVGSDTADTAATEAQLLDDLTVLSRGEEEKLVQRIEDNVAAPERVEGTGNENVQTGARINEEKHADRIVEGDVVGEKIAVARYQTNDEVVVPPQETTSSGQQDPVPPISQPLPAAEIAFDPASQGKDTEPAAPPPDVVTTSGGAKPATQHRNISLHTS